MQDKNKIQVVDRNRIMFDSRQLHFRKNFLIAYEEMSNFKIPLSLHIKTIPNIYIGSYPIEHLREKSHRVYNT